MTNQELSVKTATSGWHSEIKATNDMLDKLTDEQLMLEIAPGRNRGVYLLGHLTAVHDLMLPLLRFEDAKHPELQTPFLRSPDKTVAEIPSAQTLREQWKSVNEKLATHMANVPADEWFTRHASVSEEDFAKEPHRNRLNVLAGRTNHLSYHRGQMALLVTK